MPRRQPYIKDPNAPKPQIGRILSDLFANYKKRLCLVIVCIIISAIAGATPSLLQERLIDCITRGVEIYQKEGGEAAYQAISPDVAKIITFMICLFAVGLIATTTYTINMRKDVCKNGEAADKIFRHPPARRHNEPLHKRYRHAQTAYLAGIAAGDNRGHNAGNAYFRYALS